MTLREWIEYAHQVPAALFVSDAWTLLVECKFMRLLGCKYHLFGIAGDHRCGWYRDDKFFTEKM